MPCLHGADLTEGPGEQRGGEWGSLHRSEYTQSHLPDDECAQEGGTPGRGRRNRMYKARGVHGACMGRAQDVHRTGCAPGNSK